MKFTKSDQQLLAEAYENVQEGFLDRIRASGAGMLGAIKGTGQKIQGASQKAIGSVASKLGATNTGSEIQQKGQEKIDQVAKATKAAKIDSYKKSANKNIENLMTSITTDLTKLGIAIDESELLAAKDLLTTSLNQALDNLKN